jgi:hypothetical protein
MKPMKHLGSLFLLACLSSTAFAANGITLGGGLNFSTNDKDPGDGIEKSSRMGYNLGIGYEKETSPGFFLVPELNIETRGVVAKGYDEDTEEDAKATLKMTYLQVPVFAMFKVPAGNALLSFFGGPSFGLNLSSEVALEEAGNKVSFDTKDGTEDFDFGIEFGGGLEFASASGSFFLRPSYYFGLTDYGEGGDAKNRNFKLKVGYRIPR